MSQLVARYKSTFFNSFTVVLVTRVIRTLLQPWLINRASKRSGWIYSRTACLGNDVLKIVSSGELRILRQKVRVDRLTFEFSESGPAQRLPLAAARALQNKFVWPLIEQQFQKSEFAKLPPPKFVLVDTFSDLTDQLFFLPQQGASFFANFSDVRSSMLEDGSLVSFGLLPLDSYFRLWYDTVREMRSMWGPVPIIFVCYPTFKERRGKYLQRAEQIRGGLEELTTAVDRSFLIHLEDGDIPNRVRENLGDDSFPYHYPDWVYRTLAEQAQRALRECE